MTSCIVLGLSLLLCFTCVAVGAEGEVEDLTSLVESTEQTVAKAKTHVEHMLNLDPLPNHEKIPPVVKNESEHLAYEMKQLTTKLHALTENDEHMTPEMKSAVSAGVTRLNEHVGKLEHVGSDMKHDSAEYFTAVDQLIHEVKAIMAVGPHDKINPIIKHSLHELTHDVNNYQYGVHNEVGEHGSGGSDGGHGHHAGGTHHHVHAHGGKSSEEHDHSSSSEEHGHGHHHHH